MDNASTTPIDKEVLKEIFYHLQNNFGNPGSIHMEGLLAKKALDNSRKIVAESLGCNKDEIIFTGGGTESNNLAIQGVLDGLKNEGVSYNEMRVIFSKIEHPSVLNIAKKLESMGVIVDYLPVLSSGIVDLESFKKLLRPETVLVSVHYANNEIGVVEPIKEIAKIIRSFRKHKNLESIKQSKNIKPFFHVDASQAFSYLDCKVESLGVDLLTIDGQKIYGPKGVGALYVKKYTPIKSIIFGGHQEGGIRPGTENVPMICGLAHAISLADSLRTKESERVKKMRDYLIKEIKKIGQSKIIINGDLDNRLPNNISLSLLEKDAEFLTLQLDSVGIALSTKSACSESKSSSYVVMALGLNEAQSKNTLRISLGRNTKMDDCKKLLIYLKKYL